MAVALDMALDDVIGNSKGSKGSGKQSKGWSKGWSKGKGKREKGGASFDKLDSDDKLDKSLDEIVDATWTRGSKGKGSDKGKGKSKSWNSEEDGFGGSGWKGSGQGYGKNYSKGKGKFNGKGKGGGNFSSDYRPAWLEHEDRDEDFNGNKGYSAKGSRFGKGGFREGGGAWSGHDERGPAPRGSDSWGDMRGGRDDARPRRGSIGLSARELQRKLAKPVAKVATSNGGFLRIEQDDDEEVDSPPRRRRIQAQGATRALGNRAVAAAAAKRGRARDEEEDEPRPRAKVAKVTKSATKLIKVTNIPKELKARDVREAFESETGKAAACELSKGTAHITFLKADDAKKAVEAFHKGELNGKIISVVLVEN